MYKLLIDHVHLASACSPCRTLKAFILGLAARADPPAASGTSSKAAPTFVQLGVMGADVVPYIPQSKEHLTAEQTWPVLALDVPEAMHD